ncbi:Uncharacterised protein [Leclercia adecarboxylata]|uniref:Uncharacterized protein n=1 Tax=Leclercia adecarboxylata TaxID=83655 RepID=A0A4U9HUZ9_9ENTR|nr:Uncharacterised protein [Leclercia adecarboxylata]
MAQNTVFYQITLFIGWQLRLIRPMDAARLSPGKPQRRPAKQCALIHFPQEREQTHETVT